MAPESTGNHPELREWRKTPYLDIYSFGLVVFQVATDGMMPFEDGGISIETGILTMAVTVLIGQLPGDTPVEFRRVMKSTTRFHPLARASLDRVEHTFWKYMRKKIKKTKYQTDIHLTMNMDWE
jgi:hypothetical protein